MTLTLEKEAPHLPEAHCRAELNDALRHDSNAMLANPNADDMNRDEMLLHWIAAELEHTHCPELDPNAVEIAVFNGTITLDGIVSSYKAMRVACDVAHRASIGARVKNGLLLTPY